MNAATPQEITPGWLRYSEAERYSGLGRTTLTKLVYGGKVRASKVGKSVRINRESLDEYLERQAIADAQG